MASVLEPLAEIHSLQELRPRHVELLQAWPELDADQKLRRAEEFRKTATKAGAWIKDLTERDGAQGLIDYWTATMSSLPELAAYPNLVALAPFDPKTVQSRKRRSPYVGLNPFRIADRDRYYGRQRERDALIAKLKKSPMLIVAGLAGLGKSSLVQAGVGGRLVENRKWSVLPAVMPGLDPVAALLRAVQPENAEEGWLDDQRALAGGADHFRNLVEQRVGPHKVALLIVDQAEELFTADVGGADVALAGAMLASLSKAGERHRTVLAIREEFVEQLRAVLGAAGAELPDWAIVRPKPATAEDLTQATTGPAEASGFRFEPAVIEDLVGELADQQDALPLLQLTLTRLWNEAEVDRVSWADYQAIGRPSQIIQSSAERAYAKLDGEREQAMARLAFLELIRLGNQIARRRLRRDRLREALATKVSHRARLDRVLKRFVNAGLIRCEAGDSSGDDRLEIAHEVVIHRWPRLLIWLQERRRQNEGRERAMGAFDRWRRRGRRWRDLLFGQTLKDAYEFEGTSDGLDEFIAASRRWQRALVASAAIGAGLLLFALIWIPSSTYQNWGLNDLLQALKIQEVAARSDAIEETVLGDDFRRRAALGEQTLLRLLSSGAIAETVVADDFLRRTRLRPGPIPEAVPYDPDFLRSVDAGAAALTVPVPAAPSAAVRVLRYPHLTVLYDTARHIPLLTASNYDRDATPLPPFPGIGAFPDPRLADRQSRDRVSPNPNYGRVALNNFAEVAWTMPGDRLRDGGFLSYAPLSVTQPWSFYQGAWARLETQLLNIPARRVIFLTGPVLRPDDAVIGGAIVPRSYWKIAVYRDGQTGVPVIQAYLLGLGSEDAAVGPRSLTTVAEISRVTGLNFGALGRSGQATAPPPQNAADAPGTVYLQFAVMPRRNAVEIGRVLAAEGYIVPGEERVRAAAGLHEIRFGDERDRPRAEALATRLREILAEQGYGDLQVRAVRPQGRRPRAGVLELWIGVPPPADLAN